MPKVNVTCSKDYRSAIVTVEFPWLKQAMAFAKMCKAILDNSVPLVEGEDKTIVEKAE